jgi:hypothetical protein
MRLVLVAIATGLLVVSLQASAQADSTTGDAQAAAVAEAAAADDTPTPTDDTPEVGQDAAEETTAVEPDQGPESDQVFIPLSETARRRVMSQEGGALVTAAAQTWAACGIFDRNTKIVRTFNRYRANAGGQYIPGGTSNLACGSDEYWGYRHIVAGHLSQWENVAFPTGENWRDVADQFIAGALIDPDVVTYRQDNDTFAYCRLMYLIDKRSGRPVGVSYPRVVVAHVTKNIITAYPDSKHC